MADGQSTTPWRCEVPSHTHIDNPWGPTCRPDSLLHPAAGPSTPRASDDARRNPESIRGPDRPVHSSGARDHRRLPQGDQRHRGTW